MRDLWLVERPMPISALSKEDKPEGPVSFCFVFPDRKTAVKWAAGKYRVTRIVQAAPMKEAK